jgi:demethylsterigmatocystin 6-O-methyltransferase
MHLRFDNLCPILMALPEFLAERKYQDIVDGQDTVFQNVFKTDQHCFPWIASQPNRIANFQVLMTVERSPNWLSTFPMEGEVGTWSADGDKAIFVDMGAGLGQGCTQFRDIYPNLPGRIVLQELPPFIQIMKPLDRVELMAHNFFTPQPVKGTFKQYPYFTLRISTARSHRLFYFSFFLGAKFYFLRLILRDYTDEVAIDILKNIIPAMDETHSRIIVDDVVAPETGAHWAETGTDICIMGALGSRERTEKHWKELFFRAGLQFKGLYPWSHPVVNAAMVLALG